MDLHDENMLLRKMELKHLNKLWGFERREINADVQSVFIQYV